MVSPWRLFALYQIEDHNQIKDLRENRRRNRHLISGRKLAFFYIRPFIEIISSMRSFMLSMKLIFMASICSIRF